MGQVPSTMGAIGRLVTVSVMVLKRLDDEMINVGPVQRSCGSLDYCLVQAEGAVSMNTCHFLSHVGPTSKMEKVRHSRLTYPSRELFVYLAVFVKVDEAKVPKNSVSEDRGRLARPGPHGSHVGHAELLTPIATRFLHVCTCN